MEQPCVESKVTMCQMEDISKYLAKVDPADADADFYTDFSKNSDENIGRFWFT